MRLWEAGRNNGPNGEEQGYDENGNVEGEMEKGWDVRGVFLNSDDACFDNRRRWMGIWCIGS